MIRKKFPHYKQTDAKNCGDTCLRIISKHYGSFISTLDIEKISRVNKEGISFLNLSKTASDLGFRTLESKVDFKTLKTQGIFPCVVYWERNHFVVVYKITRKKVFISDPARGLVEYDIDEFLQKWHGGKKDAEGYIMLLEPTTRFYQTKKEKETISFKYILSYFYLYRGFFYQIVISLLILSTFQFISPFLTQSVIDIGVANSDLNFIFLILIMQLFLFFAQTSVSYIQSWIFLHLTTRINISLVSDFFLNLMKLPLSFFDRKLTGDILQRIGDNYRIQAFLTGPTLSTFFSFFNLIIFSFIMLIYSKLIFLIFIVSSTLYVIWIFLFLKKRREYDQLMFEESGREKSKIIEIVNGIQEIKLHNVEDQKRWSWERVKIRLFRIRSKMLMLNQVQGFGASLINRGSSILISYYTAKLVIEGEITIGMLFAISYILAQLRAPIGNFIRFVHSYQDAKLSLERLNEVQASEKEETKVDQAYEIGSKNNIVLRNVSFAYKSGQDEVLKDINLTIDKGSITAFVGLSGSGKTTLMKLMLKFYDTYSGKISYGDFELKKIEKETWNKKCSFVFQDGYIFNDSILENVIMYERDFDIDRVTQALKYACIDNFVKSLDEGINTLIGNEGLGLSSGQKQRLLIARAIYKNAEINFFDEATSVLDAVNEHNIMENLNEFLKDRTSIIIAHRMSTIKNANKIVVFKDGEIKEVGNHKELIQLKGAYYELVKNQLEIINI
jgi:ATP-binding cassette subfamily B protein